MRTDFWSSKCVKMRYGDRRLGLIQRLSKNKVKITSEISYAVMG
jgi:hypothetical protein